MSYEHFGALGAGFLETETAPGRVSHAKIEYDLLLRL